MTNIFANKGRDAKRTKKKSLFSKLHFKLPNLSALFFGFLLGVFCSCLVVFMFATNDITLKIPAISSKQSIVIAQNTQASPVKVVQEPRFEFYTELAKTEPTQAPEPTATAASRPLDLKSPAKAINGYIVQAGSFKKAADADAVRASLTLNGIAAKIDHLKQTNGTILHRVLLGTFKNEQQAKALQQKLKNLNIDTALVLNYTE